MNAPTNAAHPLAAWKTEAQRAIALAKLDAIYAQAFGIAAQLPERLHTAAADVLIEIATANDLVDMHGMDFVQQLLSRGIADGRRLRRLR